MATPIDPLHLRQIKAAYKAGFEECMTEFDKIRPYMSLKEAYDKYGRGTVDRWIDEKMITKIKDGTGNSKVRIRRSEIRAVADASNRASWFEHHE